jgi:hypothetical protein
LIRVLFTPVLSTAWKVKKPPMIAPGGVFAE